MVVTLDPVAHVYTREDGIVLPSVSQVIRACWPVKKNYEAADPAVLERARNRGIAVDEAFSAHVNCTFSEPREMDADAAELLDKLLDWWEGTGWKGRCQVLLSDGQIAGTADLILDDGRIFDLKTVWAIDPTYHLQVAGYVDLADMTWPTSFHGNSAFTVDYSHAGIIHVTKRFPKPKVIPVKRSAFDDWLAVRRVWEAAHR